MAFSRSYSDSALSANVQRDANPGADSLKYRPLLSEISKLLGKNSKDMERLKYLCRDLGVAHSKFENMTQGIGLFLELEKLALITADDISLLVVLMQAINRYDLVKKLKSWSSKEGNWAHRLSAYRRLMLQISDSLSQEERTEFTFDLSGDPRLHVEAEDSRSFLELFVLLEKHTLIGPGDLEYFTNIMQSTGNLAIVKEIEKYLAIESSSVHNIQPSSSPSCQGILPPQQSHQPQQNSQQWHQEQQPALKTETEGRTSSATSGLKKMQELKIAEQSRAAESTPSVKTEQSDDKREASVTRDLRLDTLIIEDTTGSSESEQSSTLTNEGHMEVPAQTATDIPHPNTESEQSSTLTNEGHMEVPAQTATDIPHPNTDAGHIRDSLKYRMNRLPRGKCIIFNGENFTTEDLEKRDGTKKDVDALVKTFKDNLKFETEVEQDPTDKEYEKCLQNFAKMDHSKFDCFVCVILSHGGDGHVYGKDGGKVYISDLTGLFNGMSVHPSLVGKPKVFFIQACRGEVPQKAFPIQEDGPTMIANESDTLVSQATVSGSASCRRADFGSLFIISLCDIIDANYEKEDLLSMLTMVNERMSQKKLKGYWKYSGKQIGNPSHTLRKKIFFNEGLDE